MAVENHHIQKDDEILIIATRATIGSKSYQQALMDLGYQKITAIQTGLFVPMVEEGIFDGEILQATMNHYFLDIPKPKAIILGCTHFPFIGKALQDYFHQKPLLIHSGEAMVEYLEARYDLSLRDKEANLKIFASDNVVGLREIARRWLIRK
jgi:glutamate racemase